MLLSDVVHNEAIENEALFVLPAIDSVGIAILIGPEHVFHFANEAYCTIIGAGRDFLERPAAEVASEVLSQGTLKLLDIVYRTGESYVDVGRSVKLHPGGRGDGQTRTFDFVYQALRIPGGPINGILVQVRDVMQPPEDRTERAIPAHEVAQRLKNHLAMVQAVATQTLRNSSNLEEAAAGLSKRISILGRAHDTLVDNITGRSCVRQLIEQMTARPDEPAFRRIHVIGPPLKVGSRSALSISLILHELASNAVRYGALSSPQGNVHLRWGLSGPDRNDFRMVWTEIGGPKVTGPPVPRTGMKLIKAGLNGSERSDVRFDFASTGLRCTITADLAGVQEGQ